MHHSKKKKKKIRFAANKIEIENECSMALFMQRT